MATKTIRVRGEKVAASRTPYTPKGEPPEVENPEIIRVIELTRVKIDALELSILGLKERLSLVLYPASASPVEDSENISCSTGLGRDIEDLAVKVSLAHDFVNDIAQRLAI